MPRSVFLLGPDHWDDGHEVPTPLWVEDLLGEAHTRFTPKHLRSAIAVAVARESHGRVSCVVMDPKEQQEGEDDVAFFQRLETQRQVDAYFIIVPMHAKVLGTVFEGGMLVRDFKWGANPVISVFYEEGFAAEDDTGVVDFVEKGKRTQYLKSLVNRAHHLQAWETLEELYEHAVARALADD